MEILFVFISLRKFLKLIRSPGMIWEKVRCDRYATLLMMMFLIMSVIWVMMCACSEVAKALRMNKHCWENNMFVAVMSSDSALLSIPVQSTACMSSNLLAYKDSVDDVLMK